jgi:hypothetical protein
VVTPASAERLARALVALAVVGAVSTFGGVAAAEPTPVPAVEAVPVAPADEPEAPATEPTIGSWIIGGTELEGTAGQPVAKPVAKPAVKPVAKPVAQPVAQPVAAPRTVRTTRTTSTRARATDATARSTGARGNVPAAGGSGVGTAATLDGATALPFTGGHVEAALPTGVTLLLAGVALTFSSRPRRTSLA